MYNQCIQIIESYKNHKDYKKDLYQLKNFIKEENVKQHEINIKTNFIRNKLKNFYTSLSKNKYKKYIKILNKISYENTYYNSVIGIYDEEMFYKIGDIKLTLGIKGFSGDNIYFLCINNICVLTRDGIENNDIVTELREKINIKNISNNELLCILVKLYDDDMYINNLLNTLNPSV